MAAITLALPRRRVRVAKRTTGFRLGRVTRISILVLAALYFVVPLAASSRFALEGNGGSVSIGSFRQALTDPALWPALSTSLEVAGGTVALTLFLLIPTSIWVNLRLPRMRRIMQNITLLPLVVPAVVLVLGIFDAFRSFPQSIVGTPVMLALEYVVLALPYSYRSIDAGVQALDLHTLVDAGRSLGASWPQLFWRVLLPNLQGAVLGASFLTIAFVLGEFAIASLLGFNTFPTWLFQVGTEQAGEAIALSVLALVLPWTLLLVISFLGGRRRRPRPGVVASEPEAPIVAFGAPEDKE